MIGRSLYVRREIALKLVTLTFAFGLLAGLALLVFGPGNPLGKTARTKADLMDAFASAIKQALPAVTSVTATRIAGSSVQDPVLVNWQQIATASTWLEASYLVNPRGRREVARGSGVLVGPEGPLLASSRLVQGAREITVRLADERQFPAHLVGADSVTDIAVLRVDAADLSYLKFGDSSKIAVGDLTAAIGSPLGTGGTVTLGIISATGQENRERGTRSDFMQILNVTSPGSQGGALINQRGELVGIATLPSSALRTGEGVSLAIPANVARQVMNEILMLTRVVRRGLNARDGAA
jgi:S1-C subfamily serine protease